MEWWSKIIKFYFGDFISLYPKSVLVLFFISIAFVIKNMLSSPRKTIDFFDYISIRKIEKIKYFLGLNTLNNKQSTVLEKELNFLVMKKMTGVLDRRIQKKLISILFKENTLPVNYFKKISLYIKMHKNNELRVMIGGLNYFFECFLIKIIAVAIVLLTLTTTVKAINSSKITPDQLWFFYFILFISMIFSAKLWISGLSKKKIDEYNELLAKYDSNQNVDNNEK